MFTNKRLLDVLTRHQMYVESVKAGFRKDFNGVLRELNKEIGLLFAKSNFKTFDGMTKAQLNSILRDLKQIQFNIYDKYNKDIIKQLQDFMQVDNEVTKRIFATVATEPAQPEDEETATEEEANDFIDAVTENEKHTPIWPFAWFLVKPLDKVWSAIISAPLPANGVLPLQFLSQFSNGSAQMIENIVRKGYANKSDLVQVLAEIKGTQKLNLRDGAFNRIGNGNAATVGTIVQHVTSIVSAGVQSILFDKYQWISVIDSVTTAICRSRNLRIYIYGQGPLPPAHIRCRSKIKPWLSGDATPDLSFFEWMKNQPKDFQDDILGAEAGANLRSGKTKAADLEEFTNAKPMTVDEFKNKLNLMLKR